MRVRVGAGLSDYAPVGKAATTAVALFSVAGAATKDVPEAQGLVTGAGDDDAAVRARGEVEDTVGVAGEADDLRHGGVLPDDDLVLAEAVGRDDFVCVFGPGEIADLAAGVDLVDDGAAH